MKTEKILQRLDMLYEGTEEKTRELQTLLGWVAQQFYFVWYFLKFSDFQSGGSYIKSFNPFSASHDSYRCVQLRIKPIKAAANTSRFLTKTRAILDLHSRVRECKQFKWMNYFKAANATKSCSPLFRPQPHFYCIRKTFSCGASWQQKNFRPPLEMETFNDSTWKLLVCFNERNEKICLETWKLPTLLSFHLIPKNKWQKVFYFYYHLISILFAFVSALFSTHNRCLSTAWKWTAKNANCWMFFITRKLFPLLRA